MHKILKTLFILSFFSSWQCLASGVALCSISPVTLNFGSYNPTNTSPTTVVGSVTINCTGLLGIIPITYTLSFSQGSGSFSQRIMSGVGGNLKYNIYTTPTYTTILGDGTGGTGTIGGSFNATLLGASQTLSIYGSMNAKQTVKAGTYTDSILVTMNF